ncbi:MAG TPA: hypothetical protein VJP79_11850 [Nitrososphaera sp.]|nr:hypothetical protein [Nitrososphaera sp.]
MTVITLRGDLDSISQILKDAFEVEPFKRNYDITFAKIAQILGRYDLVENPRNLRFRFILCMQEFFDGIPQEQWRVKDPAFVKQSEDFAIERFRVWTLEQLI